MADDVREKQVRLSLGTKPRKFINLTDIAASVVLNYRIKHYY
jgi:hypothetical protein